MIAAWIATVMIALGAPSYTVAYPDETWAEAHAARACTTFAERSVCTDGDTFGPVR